MSRLLILIAFLVVLLVAQSLQVAVQMAQRIAFTRGSDEEQEIYLIDADGENEFQLTHNHVWDGEVAWSPSGSRLAFVRAIPKREYATQEVGYVAEDEIWIINSDGSSSRLLLNSDLYKRAETFHEASTFWLPEGLINLHWMPDESRLFAEGIAWVTSNAIWSVNLDGSKPQLFDGGNDLRMTVNGNLFYFQHNYYEDGAHNESYLVDRWGHVLRDFGELHDFYPIISPDESKLIFFAHPDNGRGREEGVYLLNLATGEEIQLAKQYWDRWIEWSPDSREIAYVADREGSSEIYVMDLLSRRERRLTNNQAPDYTPRWSPDGKEIAFVSERDGNPEIYVMSADGSKQTRLTNSPEPDVDPRWNPKPVPRLLGFEAWPVYRNHKYGKYGSFTVQYPPDRFYRSSFTCQLVNLTCYLMPSAC